MLSSITHNILISIIIITIVQLLHISVWTNWGTSSLVSVLMEWLGETYCKYIMSMIPSIILVLSFIAGLELLMLWSMGISSGVHSREALLVSIMLIVTLFLLMTLLVVYLGFTVSYLEVSHANQVLEMNSRVSLIPEVMIPAPIEESPSTLILGVAVSAVVVTLFVISTSALCPH